MKTSLSLGDDTNNTPEDDAKYVVFRKNKAVLPRRCDHFVRFTLVFTDKDSRDRAFELTNLVTKQAFGLCEAVAMEVASWDARAAGLPTLGTKTSH